MTYWFAIGPPESWQIGLERGPIWGMSLHHKPYWELVQHGDTVLCYAMKPIRGVVACGTVQAKERQNILLWPEEQAHGKALWPLLLLLNLDLELPFDRWQQDSVRWPIEVTSEVKIFKQDFQILRALDAQAIIKSLRRVVPKR